MSELTLDLYADIACVHSYLGFQQLRIALKTARARGQSITVRMQPLLIAPDAPIGASEPLQQVHRRDLGPNWRALEEGMAARGVRAGAPMNFDRVRFTSTVPALAAIQQTQDHDARQAEELTAALFHAYFVAGDLVSDLDWLDAFCRERGMPRVTIDNDALERVKAASHDARAHGINSAPTLALPDGRLVAGARAQGVYASLIEQAGTQTVRRPLTEPM